VATVQSLSELESKVKEVVMRKVDEYLSEDREGLHVSDLVYDCARRAYFNLMNGHDNSLSEETKVTFWVGKALHELALGEEHEEELIVEGIVGKFDDVIVINGEKILIDKKTARFIPKRPYEHHVRQVEYYSAMYWKQFNEDIKYGGVVYIDVANRKVRPFSFTIERSKSEIWKEMERKRERIMFAIEVGVPPAGVKGWICNYCSWKEDCDVWG